VISGGWRVPGWAVRGRQVWVGQLVVVIGGGSGGLG